MATKVWKGHVSFGLVSIPCYMNTAARSKSTELHMYHNAGCHSRINRIDVCPVCDPTAKLTRDQIIKGYETSKDSFVPITAQELDLITPESDRVMEISSCVKWNEVDPVYLAESFYLLPETVGIKAYALLVKALTDSGRVAIAKLTKSGRENIVVIRPRGAGLMVHFVYYPTEINHVAEFDSLKSVPLAKDEVKLANQLLETIASKFEPEQFKDEYATRLNTLIESKLPNSKTLAPAPVKASVTVMPDLMAALQKSLAKPKAKKAA